MHAPLFHPALKVVGADKKKSRVRTFFNMLGPMVNPALPDIQMIGVYNLEMARIYSYLLQQSDAKFTIIHSLDGYDEISLPAIQKLLPMMVKKFIAAEYLGKRMVSPQDIYGGNSTEEAAKIFLKILKGEGSWAQNAVVIANAAMALSSTGNYH